MRYMGVVRFDFRGDASIGRQYIPYARDLIGQLESIHRGSPSARKRVLPNGVVVHVTRAPPVYAAVIDASALSGGTQGEGVIVTPRDAATPDGSPTDYPQMILVPEFRSRGATWGALTARQSDPKYAALTPPKGAYLPRYSEGVKYFGNVDWKGSRDERLSWYGPYSRYWPDPRTFVITNTPFVFCQGEILLNGQLYSAETPALGGDVQGAAIWRAQGNTFLHVIHKTGDVHTLVRYSLAVDEAATTPQNAKITGHTVVSSLTLLHSRAPWFFSASGAKAVHLNDPPHPYETYTQTIGDPAVEYGFVNTPTSGSIARLTVSDTGLATWSVEPTTLSENNPVGAGPTNQVQPTAYLAVDFRGDEEVSMRVKDVLRVRADFPFKAFNIQSLIGRNDLSDPPRNFYGDVDSGVRMTVDIDGDLFALNGTARTQFAGFYERMEGSMSETIVYADLREKLVYSMQLYYEPTPDDFGGAPYACWRLYRRGQVVAEERVALEPFVVYPAIERWTPLEGYPDSPFNNRTYSPRLVMTNYIGVTLPAIPPVPPASVNVVHRVIGHFGMYSNVFSPYTMPSLPETFYSDEFGVPQVGMSAVDNGRVVFSFARRLLGDEDAIDRPALHYMSNGTLPSRTITAASDSAFFPGAPLGKPIF